MPAAPGIPNDVNPAAGSDHVVEQGRLRNTATNETDRNIAVISHLSLLSAFIIGPFAFVAPMVLWLYHRDKSPYRNDHAKEALNVGITGGLLSIIVGVSWWLVIPAIFYIAWCIAVFIGVIRASSAAGRGDYFRYPMTIRFLS